jgi:hypothetical protein
MFILTICFIVLNVYVEVVLIYRPHPVVFRNWIRIVSGIRPADPNPHPDFYLMLILILIFI